MGRTRTPKSLELSRVNELSVREMRTYDIYSMYFGIPSICCRSTAAQREEEPPACVRTCVYVRTWRKESAKRKYAAVFVHAGVQRRWYCGGSVVERSVTVWEVLVFSVVPGNPCVEGL